MALSALDYRLVLNMRYLENEEPFQNVFWFKADTGGMHSGAIIDGFVDTMLIDIMAVLSVDMETTTIECASLVALDDFQTSAVVEPGSRSSTSINAWDSWGFTYQTPIRGVHNGSKRFGAIGSPDAANGVAVGTVVPLLTTLATSLMTPFTVSGGAEINPCIVKTVKVANENGNGKFHYEPDTLFYARSVSFTGLTHQTSRGN